MAVLDKMFSGKIAGLAVVDDHGVVVVPQKQAVEYQQRHFAVLEQLQVLIVHFRSQQKNSPTAVFEYVGYLRAQVGVARVHVADQQFVLMGATGAFDTADQFREKGGVHDDLSVAFENNETQRAVLRGHPRGNSITAPLGDGKNEFARFFTDLVLTIEDIGNGSRRNACLPRNVSNRNFHGWPPGFVYSFVYHYSTAKNVCKPEIVRQIYRNE